MQSLAFSWMGVPLIYPMGAFPFAESRTAESQGKTAAAVYLFITTKKPHSYMVIFPQLRGF